MRYLNAVELVLYLVACLFGGYRAVQEIHIARTETAPSEFTADNFAQQYAGQRWVRVVGRVAVEHRHVRRSRHQAHRGKSFCYVTVPVVGKDWNPAQPVHVLATFGPLLPWKVDQWAEGFKFPKSVQGQLRPSGFRDPAGMFPRVTLAPKPVVINEGTAPNHVLAMMGFLALMALGGGMALRRLRQLRHDH